ncbi:formylglycine-generating enzyme family protein [uncultured Algibacter sp.]|uniref:formylglycine-generating enzyme family protein n=1 Tax=uncultured Algibacter sp. TaxID=298659 RepID=UPI00261E1F7A|nr:formylglycine-generating enzyme family protein [uncultured Algibacter sp.]
MSIKTPYLFALIFTISIFSCKNKSTTNSKEEVTQKSNKIPDNIPEGMVWIPGGVFNQGAVPQDKMAMLHEKPQHPVSVDGFFMDITEVTNAQFSKFVEETGYITIAEREINWEEIKRQLPPGTPKPHDTILKPGSLLFKKTKASVPNLYDFSQWWDWVIGANWRHPNGKDSNIDGKDNYPVVHISYKDALAYCEWAGRRLPTEAEWEYAARAGKNNTIYFWGDDKSKLSKMVNSWEGEFPVSNTLEDGFERLAPVKSYPANSFGLYDIAGNVWEWTNDWYNTNYYNELKLQNTTINNPTGATTAYNPNNSYIKEKVIKGGSFLCSDSYCASYRVSSRMASDIDSAQEHLGFRTVATPEMLN